jgi:hypothetical protein
MSEPKIPVLIATPLKDYKTLDKPHPYFRATLEDIAKLEDSPYEFTFATMDGGICHARNRMVHEAKKRKMKWLLWWDYDVEATIDHVLRILGHKRPRCAALYTTREKDGHWCTNFMHEVTLQPGNLLQVIESGQGFKLEHMQVYENMEASYPGFWYTDRQTGERMFGYYQHRIQPTDLKPDGDELPEDFWFDYLCRMAKIGLFVDTTMKLKHRGPDGTLYPTGDWPPIPMDESK